MPFGFEETQPIIDEAILYAKSKSVLIFAAATSNSSDSSLTAWPARSTSVVCVYASDGVGNSSRGNPRPLPNDANLAVLGESVQGYYPPEMLTGGMKLVHRSGTSVASPIAAGIAAILLRILRHGKDSYTQRLHANKQHSSSTWYDRQIQTLKRPDGMKAILIHLADYEVRKGYSYVAPWRKWSFRGFASKSVIDDMLHVIAPHSLCKSLFSLALSSVYSFVDCIQQQKLLNQACGLKRALMKTMV